LTDDKMLNCKKNFTFKLSCYIRFHQSRSGSNYFYRSIFEWKYDENWTHDRYL